LNNSPIVTALCDSVLELPGTIISDRPLRIEYCLGHQRRARWCAAGFDQIPVRRSDPAGELVDIWRRRATQLAPAVGSEVAVADVVGEDEHDVGLLRLLRDCRHAGHR
jgi:hypothetical protein